MAKILTQELVNKAVELLRPAVEKILEDKDCIWGPAWVELVFSGHNCVFAFTKFGNKTEWNDEWGEEKNFYALATAKHDLSRREGMSSSQIVLLKPWLLERGDWLYSGSSCSDDLVCGVSGAKGEIDEMIADLLITTVKGLCVLRRKELQDNGVKQIC